MHALLLGMFYEIIERGSLRRQRVGGRDGDGFVMIHDSSSSFTTYLIYLPFIS